MRKLISLILAFCMTMIALPSDSVQANGADYSDLFLDLSDPALRRYAEGEIYGELVKDLAGEGYFVENVETIYLSKEYLEELAYNSQVSIYFGYTLAEIEEQFQGEKFVFTLDDKGNTIVKAFEPYQESALEISLKNVAVGAGVILISVTAGAISGGLGAPAISAIFYASAKSAALFAAKSGAIGGVAAGVVKGVETGDMNQALEAAALAGSEGFKWGAVGGAVNGGAKAYQALKGATLSGLTMNEAALIQQESGYPLDVIKAFRSMEQYQICKEAGLIPVQVNGRVALIRQIDLNFIDEFGQTNLQRMQQGLAAIDPATGESFQLHHVGQKQDSTLAILTRGEHMQGGNNQIWHEIGKASEVDRVMFNSEKAAFWKTMASILVEGVVEWIT